MDANIVSSVPSLLCGLWSVVLLQIRLSSIIKYGNGATLDVNQRKRFEAAKWSDSGTTLIDRVLLPAHQMFIRAFNQA